MFRKLPLLLIGVLSAGCALTEYPIITDEDQLPKVLNTHNVNTADLAYVKQKLQVAVIKPGGETRESVWFIQQDAGGNQTISNYVNIGHLSCIGQGCVFHGTTYLNNDREGCWWVRAPNAASEPNFGFDNIFGFETNEACKNRIGGAEPPVRLAKFVRSMEAGRDRGAGVSGSGVSSTSLRSQGAFGVTLHQAIDVAGQLDAYGTYGDWRSEYGLEGWKFTVTPDNLKVELANSSAARTQIMFDGVVAVLDLRNGKAILDARTGNMPDALRQIGDWVQANGQAGTVYVTFAGVTGHTDVGLANKATWYDMADQLD